MTKGIFLCIEGPDGSGKGTQEKLLADHLKALGYPVVQFSFPRYDTPTGQKVADYLNGTLGQATAVDPREASKLFAADRKAAVPEIMEALARGKIVLADRFTLSNMAHQGAKLKTHAEREELFDWLEHLEHERLEIPRPDRYILLHLPAAIAQVRIGLKQKRSYTTQKLDGHEADIHHLESAEQTYLDLAAKYPGYIQVVKCAEGSTELTAEQIHERVWEHIEVLLPSRNRGKYIVLEGPEGVGKTTQLVELARRLQAAELPVRIFSEPDGQSDLTARAIRSLTKDPRYGKNTHTEVLLYNAARSQSLQVIKDSVAHGIICLVDRSYLATLAIQYYGYGTLPDYETVNRIISFAVDGVEPDLCIILDAPVSALTERIQHQYDRNVDIGLLERIRAGYLWEAKQRSLPVIFATESKDIVADNIWKLVTQTLADRRHAAQAAVAPPIAIEQLSIEMPVAPALPPDEPYVVKAGEQFAVTQTGKRYLDEVLTNSESNVYTFTNKLNPMTVAAAMARLSRRGDDMRVTLLDEFAGKEDKDKQLLRRIITAYGDDSVQQLVGLHVVVEQASNLAAKKLEWGRLAAYLEQSTRYIYFDTKNADGRYKYHIPTHFDEPTKQHYTSVMDQIFSLYSTTVRALAEYLELHSTTPETERDGAWRGAVRAQACDAGRAMLPVATTTTIGIYASGQALESLIMHLVSDDLLEARITGQKILNEARKVIPTFLERADKPDRGGAIIAYRSSTRTALKELADVYLPTNHADQTTPVTLTDYWPRNELDLIPDMLYEFSDQPLEAIRAEVATWNYDKKLEVFRAYMGERLNRRHKPGRALEKAHYSWDLVCDYGIFRDLQRHRMVDDLEWQALSPRYGFETPKLIEDAGLSDSFEQCFALSLELYSYLQSAGYALEAQYATLLGHRMRWKVTYNAREAFHLHELRTSPQGHPGYRQLILDMHHKLAEVHPQLAEHMTFVNHGEDPELSRLAAERYTQFKLAQLDTAVTQVSTPTPLEK